MSNILAFIPARGGSISIPLKNMARINDIPLVGWSLHAATRNSDFKKIVVSTDNNIIRDYCQQFRNMSGDDRITVIERPGHLRDGESYPIQDVVLDYLDKSKFYRYVALLQPTSPFIRQWQIDHCITTIRSKGCKSCFTIAEVPHNMNYANQRSFKYGLVKFLFPEIRRKRWNKQKKERSYMFGNFVVADWGYIKDGFFPTPAAGVVIDRVDAIDVDTMDDLRMAEHLLPLHQSETAQRWAGVGT